jgi:hypothetical protein
MPGVDIAVRPYGAPPPEPYAELPAWVAPEERGGQGSQRADPYAQLPEWKPPEQRPSKPEVGTLEAAVCMIRA